MKRSLKNNLPSHTWNSLSKTYRSWNQEIAWRLNLKSWISAHRISTYKNKHIGERCFIIGNGPSLNQMDLSPLHNENTFGLNRIYLLFPHIGFQTTYFISVNRLVIEQFADEIACLPMPQFLSRRGVRSAHFFNNIMFLHHRPGLKFSKVPNWYIYEGPTVTFVALQLAYYMGFRQAILIGVDHHFHTQGPPNQEVVSPGDDPNHFTANYFGKGVRWQLPDLHASEVVYTLAREVYTRDNRSILDATLNGKLQIFPKVPFGSLFPQH